MVVFLIRTVGINPRKNIDLRTNPVCSSSERDVFESDEAPSLFPGALPSEGASLLRPVQAWRFPHSKWCVQLSLLLDYLGTSYSFPLSCSHPSDQSNTPFRSPTIALFEEL